MQQLEQLYALSKRNITVRYKHSVVGFLWGFFKPALYLLIFIVIFGAQFSSTSNHILYITSGILFWFFFANCSSQGLQSIVQSAGLIKSIQIPPLLFPLAEVISELFNVILALIVFLIMMYGFEMVYSWQLLWIIPVLLVFAVFCFSVTLILSAFHVYFRDVGILWNTLQPAMFYLTPIAYTESLIPERFSMIIHLNPVYAFIRLFRAPIYEAASPDMVLLLKCMMMSTLSLGIGIWIFNRLKNQFITAI
jgi:ABC-type polysaccharide/polyol phosphate export permease